MSAPVVKKAKSTEGVMQISREMLDKLSNTSKPEAVDATLQVDVGMLSVFDNTPLETTEHNGNVELSVKEQAQYCVQQLVNKLFMLPSEPAEIGRLASLPDAIFKLPREKPAPVPRPETVWEKFAKQKGITKQKRSRMIFDEEKQEYKARWGYKRGNDAGDNWLIEQKANDTDTTDPWKKLRDEKKERVEKNKKQQLNNLKKASGARVLPGSIDLSSAAGVSRGKRNQLNSDKGSKKNSHLDIALGVAQKSTNSMGKFDKLRHGEPSIKAAKKARKDNILQVASEEKKQSMAVLSKVLGKQEEKDKLFLNKAISDLGLHNLQKGELRGSTATGTNKKLGKKGTFKDIKVGKKGSDKKGGSFKGKGGFKAKGSGKGKSKSSK
jgi:regulator of ribosome biosynthesis